MRPVANGGAMKTGQPRDGSAFVGAVREPPVAEWRRAGTHYRRPMNAPRRGEISRRRKTRAVHEPPLRDLTPSGGWFPNCGMPLRNPSRRRASRVDNHRGLSLQSRRVIADLRGAHICVSFRSENQRRAVPELWGIPGEGKPLRDQTPFGGRFPNHGADPMRNRPREGESALHDGGDFPSGGDHHKTRHYRCRPRPGGRPVGNRPANADP